MSIQIESRWKKLPRQFVAFNTDGKNLLEHLLQLLCNVLSIKALSNIACMFDCRCQYGVTEWLSPRSTLHIHTLCMCKFNVFNSKTSSH